MTTTTHRSFRRMLFNDGEAIVPEDFEAISQIAGIMLDPLLTECQVVEGVVSSAAVFSRAFAGAPFAHLTEHRTIYLHEGAVYLVDVTLLGEGFDKARSMIRPAWVPRNHPITFAVGDATHPRWDVVQVKIDDDDVETDERDFEDAVTRAISSQVVDKERFWRLTIGVKQGAPAASPTEPAVDSGFQKLCAVRIPAGLDAGLISVTDIRDYRVPIGALRVLHVPAHQFSFSPSFFTVSDAQIARASGTPPFRVYCPEMGLNARILRVGMTVQRESGSASTLNIVRHAADSLSSVTVLQELAGLWPAGDPGRYREVAPDVPLWGNGFAAGMAHGRPGLPAATLPSAGLHGVLAGAADILMWARFIVAGP